MGFFERHERRMLTIAAWLWGLTLVLFVLLLVPVDWLRFAGCR